MTCVTCNTYFRTSHDEGESDDIRQCPQCGEWRCVVCSFINRPKQRVCYVCKAKKGECSSPLSQEYTATEPGPSPYPDKSEVYDPMDNSLGSGELRVVVIGNSRHAKNLAGDLILEEQTFSSRERDNRCRVGFLSYKSLSLSVVNTPALFDSELKEHKIQREFRRMILLSSPGPHLFLHVVDEDDPENNEDTLGQFIGLFGEDMLKFTMKLCISRETKSAESMEGTLTLSDLGNSHQQILLESIENFIMKNGGAHFGHELFVEIHQLVQHCADGKLKKDEELVQKVRDLEKEKEKMRLRSTRDSQKILDLEAEIRRCNAKLKMQEEQRLQDCRKRLIDDETLDKIFAGLKVVGSHLLTVALSFAFKKLAL